jgi:hypothetical protein
MSTAPSLFRRRTGTPSDTSHTYTFLGWIASSVDNQTSVGTYYAAGASYTVTAAATLKALYSYATTGTGSSTYTLVTDAASLTTGSNIVIAASGYDYAIGTTQNSNNRAQVAVTKDTTANTLSFTGSVAEFTLGAGSTTGTYSFYDSTNSGYLYAASSTSNYLRTETTLSANSSWTITIASGVATIVANGSNSRITACSTMRRAVHVLLPTASGNTQKGLALYQKGAGSTTYYTTSEFGHDLHACESDGSCSSCSDLHGSRQQRLLALPGLRQVLLRRGSDHGDHACFHRYPGTRPHPDRCCSNSSDLHRSRQQRLLALLRLRQVLLRRGSDHRDHARFHRHCGTRP